MSKQFMTRGEAKALREKKAQEDLALKQSDDPTTRTLKNVLIGLMAGKLGVEQVSFHHFDESGNVVNDDVIKAIK